MRQALVLTALLLPALMQAALPLMAAAPLWPAGGKAASRPPLPAWTHTAFCAPAGWVPPQVEEDAPRPLNPAAPWCPLCLLPAITPLLGASPPVRLELPLATPAPRPQQAVTCPRVAHHTRLKPARGPPPSLV